MTEGIGVAIVVILFWSATIHSLILQKLSAIKDLLALQRGIDKANTSKDE